MTSVRVLERVAHRAPLAVRCRDGVTGAGVGGGLVATAWPRADVRRRYPARRSPVSELLGWGSLPIEWEATHQVADRGEPVSWPATTPTPYAVLVVDTEGRYLPVSLSVDLPVAAPVDVPLSSSPARRPISGMGLVRGEVRADADDAALAWALVLVDTGTVVHQTVADRAGRFQLQLPYPEALPPLVNPATGLAAVTWDLSVSVRSEPDALVRSPGLAPDDPPELGSITGQGGAQLDDGGGPQAAIDVTLAFGAPLTLPLRAIPA